MPKNLLLLRIAMAAGSAVAVYLLLLGAGYVFPSRIEAAARITINRPPENVWWVLTDYNHMAAWHPQYRNATTLTPPGEAPLRWQIEYSDGYVVNAEVVEEKFPSRLVERITDGNLPFGGGWTVELTPVGPNTEVTVHSKVEIHAPIQRLIVHLLVPAQTELERILEALKGRVESVTVRPGA
jgi:uncharacterized protein YndB with AHSA1/START domain